MHLVIFLLAKGEKHADWQFHIVGSLASEFLRWSWNSDVGIPMLDIGIPTSEFQCPT